MHKLAGQRLFHLMNFCLLVIKKYTEAGPMDTILAAQWRGNTFLWISGPLTAKPLEDTFELWVTEYGGSAPETPVSINARVILDGDDDFRYRDVPDTGYEITYFICQIERLQNLCPKNYDELKGAQHCYSFQRVTVKTYQEANDYCFENVLPNGNGYTPFLENSGVLTIESERAWNAIKTYIWSHFPAATSTIPPLKTSEATTVFTITAEDTTTDTELIPTVPHHLTMETTDLKTTPQLTHEEKTTDYIPTTTSDTTNKKTTEVITAAREITEEEITVTITAKPQTIEEVTTDANKHLTIVNEHHTTKESLGESIHSTVTSGSIIKNIPEHTIMSTSYDTTTRPEGNTFTVTANSRHVSTLEGHLYSSESASQPENKVIETTTQFVSDRDRTFAHSTPTLLLRSLSSSYYNQQKTTDSLPKTSVTPIVAKTPHNQSKPLIREKPLRPTNLPSDHINPDTEPLAIFMGTTAIFIVLSFVIGIVMMDLNAIIRDFKIMRRNIKSFIRYHRNRRLQKQHAMT